MLGRIKRHMPRRAMILVRSLVWRIGDHDPQLRPGQAAPDQIKHPGPTLWALRRSKERTVGQIDQLPPCGAAPNDLCVRDGCAHRMDDTALHVVAQCGHGTGIGQALLKGFDRVG